MEGNITTLEDAVAQKSQEDIISQLNGLVTSSTKVEYTKVPVLINLLTIESEDVKKLTSQLIAETAKIAENRQILTDSELMKLLLSTLDTSNSDCLTQLCRALGNLCYENDKARDIVTSSEGLPKLLTIIESNLASNNMSIVNIACGFLINYLTSNESAQKSALEQNVLSLLEKIIRDKMDVFSDHEELYTNVLLILNSLAEFMGDTWFSEKLCLDLVKILEKSINPEISEITLDLLHIQGENDAIKLILAKGGLCELLYKLLEEHKSLVQDDEGRALMKLACDLIVLILTGDDAMVLLYAKGQGVVYNNMKAWLSSDDTDLLITGILAMGNFARNDSHCIRMVETGMSEILLDMLRKHNDSKGDIRIQHALLSALRNLVIPTANKKRLLENGIIDAIYPLLATQQQPVIFKLLGTLRMVIDGQEETSIKLASNVDLLRKIVDWCFNSDHPGVRAESPRLLSWIIKHCHSSKPYLKMIQVKDCIKCLVEMITSPHVLMQNEALIALNILCASCINEEGNIQEVENTKLNLANVLINADIGGIIYLYLSKSEDKVEKEVFENLLTLLDCLDRLPNVNTHLRDSQIGEILNKYAANEVLKKCNEKIRKIMFGINSS